MDAAVVPVRAGSGFPARRTTSEWPWKEASGGIIRNNFISSDYAHAKREGLDPTATFATVVMERVLDLIAVLILLAVGPDKLPTMVKTVAKTYRLDLAQVLRPTPGQSDKEPMVIPLVTGHAWMRDLTAIDELFKRGLRISHSASVSCAIWCRSIPPARPGGSRGASSGSGRRCRDPPPPPLRTAGC